MIKKFLTSALILLYILPCIFTVDAKNITWELQSIDTMKTSRDQTLYKKNDRQYDSHIKTEIERVRDLGATHVTVDGAYDDEYLEWMNRWVLEARRAGLNVWFRGNFSGWHGWFGDKNMTREEHVKALRRFIISNPHLFEDGDVFTACPECEYGGPGNPLETGDLEGFRAFMQEEVEIMRESFESIDKNINYTYTSMNPDVAKQVMTPELVNSLGNVITLDYFFNDIAVLTDGLDYFRERFPGVKFVIGEFGAPIPEINGAMSDKEKRIFIQSVFQTLYEQPDVIGVNYWVSTGGATELFDSKLRPVPAAEVVNDYFSPKIVSGVVRTRNNMPISNATVALANGDRMTKTDANGSYSIPIVADTVALTFIANGNKTVNTRQFSLSSSNTTQNMTLSPINGGGIWGWLKHLLNI